ncbi:MAG: TIGR03915 family putative DNA repair protein [Clostridiales bacterium]|jgi:probable DNA metabolism protein|nr:TIGR03915 family putative DNA repair protein [Clostridiales bacterium]
MKILLSPPSVNGFFTAVYHAYYTHKDAEKIVSAALPRNFLDEYIEVDEDESLAERVKNGIKKISRALYGEILYALRSGSPDKEETVFGYLKLSFKHGAAAAEMFGENAVSDFGGILRKVKKELERLLGFIRLKEMQNGAYYGFFSSDNDILDCLASNFAKRFSDRPFILHDYKRKKAAVWDGAEINYFDMPENVTVELSENETAFQNLWKTYHKTIAVKERSNPRLQRGFAPKKYRHFMSEFDG